MAGTLKIVALDADASTVLSVALGLTSNVKGVHFDGYYFWCADTARIYQVLLDGANAYICSVVDISATLPGTSPEITALCGNEHYLWVAYKHTTNSYEVAQYTKQGNRVFKLTGFDRASAAGTEWFDLALYGDHYIISERDSGPVASDEETVICDLSTGVQVRQTINRNRLVGIEIDGASIWKIEVTGKISKQDIDNFLTYWSSPAVISTGVAGLTRMSRRYIAANHARKISHQGAHFFAVVHN